MNTKNISNLGIFSLGISYFLYAFIQYFFTPICWWFGQHIDSLEWMNNILYYSGMSDSDIFTMTSLGYSLVGVISFYFGYCLLSAKLFRINNGIVFRKWEMGRAELVFWILFLSGFALKTIKVLAGFSIEDVVYGSIGHSFISNPLITFYLSLNWFNLIALIVINIAYQEAKEANELTIKRLRKIAYSYNTLFLLATLSTGGKTATLFPIFGLLIIWRYYSTSRISAFKIIASLALVIFFIFSTKILLSQYFQIEGAADTEDLGLRFALFYTLFYRVNMSQVMAAVIEGGQKAFPSGTLSQFWVNMSLYGTERKNVFDGNEFGRILGLISSNDFSTGVASTNMGELFINYDILGVAIGMLLTGILYKILFSNCRRRTPFFVMLYSLMWPILIHGMESPISVLYATSIKMIFLCIFVQFAIAYK